MAAPLMHSVEIQADPEKIYEAIASGPGLAAFWTADSKAKPEVGSIAEFGFGGPKMQMRIEELKPGRRVVWTALSDWPDWPGTTVTWDIDAKDGGATEVRFAHAGWAEAVPQEKLASINYTWAQVVGRLKKYAETGKPDPYFP